MLSTQTDCLSDELLRQLLSGQLSQDGFAAAATHLDHCQHCQTAIEKLQSVDAMGGSGAVSGEDRWGQDI